MQKSHTNKRFKRKRRGRLTPFQRLKRREFKGYTVADYFNNLIDMNITKEVKEFQYQCLFQHAHVVPLTKILFLFVTTLWFAYFIVEYPESYIVIWFPVLAATTTVIGLKQRASKFMWPLLPSTGILFLFNAIGTVVIMYGAFAGNDDEFKFLGKLYKKRWKSRSVIYYVLDVVCLLVAMVLFYCCYVFNLCRQYFEDLEKARIPTTYREAKMHQNNDVPTYGGPVSLRYAK